MTELHQIRESKGVTRRWLARQLGVSRAALWRYENGKVRVPRSLLFHAAHLLHVSPTDLTDATH